MNIIYRLKGALGYVYFPDSECLSQFEKGQKDYWADVKSSVVVDAVLDPYSYINYLEKNKKDVSQYNIFRYFYDMDVRAIYLPVSIDYLKDIILKSVEMTENDDAWKAYIPATIESYLGSFPEIVVPGIDVYLGIIGLDDRDYNLYESVNSIHVKGFQDFNDYFTWAKHGSDFPSISEKFKSFGYSDWTEYNKINYFLKVMKDTGDESFCNSSNDAARMILYKGIYDSKNITASVAAAFDYIYFLVLRVLYYYMWKRDIVPNENIIRSCLNLKYAANKISEYVSEEDPCYENIKNLVIPFPKELRRLHKELRKYTPYDFECDGFSFSGLMSFINSFRNDTKGHGVLEGKMADIILRILLYYISFLHIFLAVDRFECITICDYTKMLYSNDDSDDTSFYPNIYFDGYYTPNLLWKCEKNKKRYMNFFEGDYIVPSL